jgi:hypothetical protein
MATETMTVSSLENLDEVMDKAFAI